MMTSAGENGYAAAMAEFLPLCDVLFNVISLLGYFCDVVFDVVMSYALLQRGYKATFAAALVCLVSSLVITQILSLRWYLHVWSNNSSGRKGRPPWLPILLHCLQLGVLWRYARLFVPVDLRQVKHHVRDLCMLRLVHAFVEAAPMLLLQLHVLLATSKTVEPINELDPIRDEPIAANRAFSELIVISAIWSLFSVCWALASFSKNVRLQNVHRLVLTWLGLIFQFLWRLGTVSARIYALTVYALVYNYWVFLVIALHWLSMFLWLMSPKSVFHGERVSRLRKTYLSSLIAVVYVFAYINLHEHNHRQKMVVFYTVMIIENCVLVGAWAGAGAERGGGAGPLAAAAATLCGLAAMVLYYRYFHVRRLGYLLGENQQGTNSTNASSNNKNGKQLSSADNAAIPGVFNCRFTNPVIGAAGRKKKKPTTFVPPPAPPAPPPAAAPAPFWKRPLPNAHHHHGGSSENEGSSVGSRVNIQQKLQEKKQKQLAELRVIEEEIKQGKLAKTAPVAVEEIYSSLQRQPIPRSKTHAEPSWPSVDLNNPYQNYPICNYPTYTEIKSYPMGFPNHDTTLYETPSNLSNDVMRPLRTNFLVLNESRNFSNPSHRINSPRLNFNPDVTPNYDLQSSLDKPRLNFKDNLRRENDYPMFNSSSSHKVHSNYAKYDCNRASHNKISQENRTYELGSSYELNNGRYPYASNKKLENLKKMQRCRTPEILLAPHYLEGCTRPVCCHWGPSANYTKREEKAGGSSTEDSGPEGRAGDPARPPSDIDSQISLPRSYTLPREFRYWRRRHRHPDPLTTSNNSSDGDVDSGDESDRRSNCSATSQLHSGDLYRQRTQLPCNHPHNLDRRRRHGRKAQAKPETKL